MSRQGSFAQGDRKSDGGSRAAGSAQAHAVDVGAQIQGWMDITTLVAELCGVKACLVLRCEVGTVEVMAASRTDGNPYTADAAAPPVRMPYADTVIGTQKLIEIPDAQADPAWRDTPDALAGMTYFCGVPVNYPDGTPFGAFCIMDSGPKVTTEIERKVINGFARVIEDHLRMELMNQSLSYDATHDPLLGLMNRRAFFDRLETQLRAFDRNGAPWALLSFDVDNFKQVNDTLGHAIGDQTLKALTETVDGIVRGADAFGRIGGEEFAIIAEVGGIPGAEALAERIRASVEASDDLRALVGHAVTISCGVALPVPGDTTDAIMARADDAMYAAKRHGRNRVRIAT